jgi:2-polyprenyl-3-methyl-5-hydroxy-6-metoxy-1,4-benzoquinol methylase
MAFRPIDYYDETREKVDHFRPLQPREDRAIELIRGLVARPDGRFLDVGCGSGLFVDGLNRATGMADRGWALVGVDVSEHAIEIAQRLPYDFRRVNLEEGIPLEDGSVDIVYAGEVIEHVYNPDALLEECRRVLRPGGHVVLTTPNLQAWYNRALFALGIQPLFYETSTKSTGIGAGPLARLKRADHPVGHLRLFNRRALLDLLESEGFLPVAMEGAIFPALPGPVQVIDRLFNARPSLSSILIVVATKQA